MHSSGVRASWLWERPFGPTAPSSERSPSPRVTEPTHVIACRAGYAAGKAVYDTSGKGAAVRESVWGGYTRRALEAGARAEADRGAWVQGCLDGVAAKPQDLPTATVTQRAENNELLQSFRAWARSNGAQEEAKHASQRPDQVASLRHGRSGPVWPARSLSATSSAGARGGVRTAVVKSSPARWQTARDAWRCPSPRSRCRSRASLSSWWSGGELLPAERVRMRQAPPRLCRP
ncbi:hypothetical protein QFZ67_007685 [Streptomyces sp. V1I1]|nr:hypothetical protein [Streptomyces sp. V1I1]